MWFKFDDSFADDARFLGLSLSARLLWVCGRCYISNRLTDGAIPRAVISGFGIRNANAAAQELVSRDLWEHYGDGFTDPTWHECIRSRAYVEHDRAQARLRKERQRKGGGS